MYHVEMHLFRPNVISTCHRIAQQPSVRATTTTTTYMPNLLVRPAAIVLQDVVLGCTRREDELLGDGLLGGKKKRGVYVSHSQLGGCSGWAGVPESRSGARRGCRLASRRGFSGSRAMVARGCEPLDG